jgi:hypothetical protein
LADRRRLRWSHRGSCGRVLAERAALQARVGRTDSLVSEMEVTHALSANIKKELSLRCCAAGAAWPGAAPVAEGLCRSNCVGCACCMRVLSDGIFHGCRNAAQLQG